MRYLNLAAVIASASLAASCGLPMTTYPYPKYGFTVDFPSAPKMKDTINPQNGAHITVLESRRLGRDFEVTFTDVAPRDIDALVEDMSQAMTRLVGGQVTYRTECATPEGVFGRELVFSKGGRRAVRARFYLSGARFYMLTAKSVAGLSPAAEEEGVDPSTESGKDEDPAVGQFLNSFHVTPAPKS